MNYLSIADWNLHFHGLDVHICTYRHDLPTAIVSLMGGPSSKAYAERVVAILARERKRQGLSHEALAEAAGVHRSTVSRTERGLMNPTLLIVHAMAVALKLPFAQIAQEAEQRR